MAASVSAVASEGGAVDGWSRALGGAVHAPAFALWATADVLASEATCRNCTLNNCGGVLRKLLHIVVQNTVTT